MFRNILKAIAGDPNKRDIQKYTKVVEAVNSLEPRFSQLNDAELRGQTEVFRARLAEAQAGLEDLKERRAAEQAALDELLPEAFAAVREAAMRAIGQRHYDVQLIGGQALHQGRIAEMRTGEGKTLVATLPTYLNALTGRGVHVITVNDYLARRDARWMGAVYQTLGLTVGVLQEAARTENGRKAFVVDFTRETAQEDQFHLRLVDRREAYAADIVYGTNHEFGFDYLRDNMAVALEQRVQRERYFAIVDEVDNILIDEARTPLIISGPAEEDPSLYYQISRVARQLKPEDYEIDERGRSIALTEIGEVHLEKLIGQPLRDPDRPEEVSPEQARLLGHVEQAMRAEFLFKRNKDYLVEGGKVVIVDEFTGRKMIGRRWSDGLHQAVEAKEGLPVQEDNVTYATITLQNYFRLYQKLAGMTGTALTEAEEFDRIYKLAVVAIPTNLEYQAARPETNLMEAEIKEDGQKFHYFMRKDDATRQPLFWRRKDYADIVFRTEEAKLRAITHEILRRHLLGQPLLVGTTSVELSERVSERLRPDPLQRLAQVLLIRQKWFENNNKEEDGMMVAELKPLDMKLEELSRQEMAKQLKELGLSSNPANEDNLGRLTQLLVVPAETQPQLLAILQGGIRHNVLNAKKHDEESRIIADAGALGAVTIATNMAGRGVDIKLGGELADEVLTNVNRVLKKAGHAAPYDLTQEQRETTLRGVPESEWGIYEGECRLFLQMMDDAVKVKQVGGLHVVGSERHEARRIDNQLRGRAARQGDPGSSQFYLSLEDDLMRRFGGQQVSDLMQRLKVDDGVPIQAGLVNRIIEQSQSRVEGYNFDVRKHLLEYDDVLNTQRNKIYEQRDRVFVKDDLTDDFLEMLEAEVKRRVDIALADEAEGGWKLMAWLEEAQPSIPLGPNSPAYYPSYMLEIFLSKLEGEAQPVDALLDLAKAALETERRHLLQTVEAQVEAAQTRLKNQTKDKRAEAEMALEALENEAHENQQPVEGRAALKAVGDALGINLQASAADLRNFELNQFKKKIPELAETAVSARAQAGLIVAIERRIGASLGLGNALKDESWETLDQQLMEAAEKAHRARAERTLAEIERELRQHLPAAPTRHDLCRALISMAWGTVTDYDQQHKKVKRMTLRLTYVFLAAERIAGQSAKDLTDAILDHLEKAYETLRQVIGENEAVRLANTKVADLPPALQKTVHQLKGEASLLATVGDLGAEALPLLGQYVLTLFMRQNMLQVIGGLWVEYLTSVEALRTSIGLEAYAQRDPLVAYKSKAFEMFQELLVNMRAGVISRAFRISFQAPEPAAPAKREQRDQRDQRDRAPAAAERPAASSPSSPSQATETAGEAGGRRHRKKR